jgi:ABC-2 type transport system ATP-binding protein
VLGFDCVKEAGKVREKIGLILGGDRGLFGRLTGVENLKYFAALNHMNREATGKRLKEIIAMVGLTTSIDRPVEQYSRGMKQRLHIARGLLTDPEILFMDEPTIGLDPQGALELRQLIPKLIEQGKTILLTTHYMAEADALSSQIAIINKGKITAAGTPSEIKHSFSKVSILEVILRQVRARVSEELSSVRGIERVSVVTDGPLQRLTLHVVPGVDVQPEVKRILDEKNIEYLAGREPTLEEAYLSIVK